MNISNARKIEGWMTDDELTWLAESAAIFSGNLIEVGCWLGRSTTVLADNTPGIVYAVDHFRGSPELSYGLYGNDEFWQSSMFKMNMDPYIKSGRVRMVVAPSDVAFTKLWNSGVRADFIFLDGSHQYMDVLKENIWYTKLLNPGGIIAGHDYGRLEFAGVQAAVDDFFLKSHTVNKAADSIWWVKL